MKPESTTYFMVVFSLMMAFILLAACTQFDRTDTQGKSWDVELLSDPAGSCEMRVRVNHEDKQEDGTFSLDNPRGR